MEWCSQLLVLPVCWPQDRQRVRERETFGIMTKKFAKKPLIGMVIRNRKNIKDGVITVSPKINPNIFPLAKLILSL